MSHVSSTTESARTPFGDFRWLAALLLTATVLRLGVVCWNPAALAEDRDLYWGLAKELAAGRGFVHPDLGHATAYRPPLYPLVLAGIVKAGGEIGCLAVVQTGLGVATVWLTWWLGQLLNLTRRASFVAAGLVAVNPLLLRSTGLAMTETLCTFLVTLMLCLAAALHRQPSLEQPSWGWKRFGLGMVVGLTALCRPTIWAFVILAAPVAMVGKPRLSWRAWLMMLCGTALVVSPWAIRNWSVFGRPIVTTTHGGYTLWLGNNEVAFREDVSSPPGVLWDSRPWQKAIRDEMQNAGLAPSDEVARDRWQSERAWTWIRQHPREFTSACWLRLRRFWNINPAGADADAVPQVMRWGIRLFFSVELIAAAVGLARLRRDGWSVWWPLTLLIASFSLTHLLYWSNLRMRAPIEPALALFAAKGLLPAARRRTKGGKPH